MPYCRNLVLGTYHFYSKSRFPLLLLWTLSLHLLNKLILYTVPLKPTKYSLTESRVSSSSIRIGFCLKRFIIFGWRSQTMDLNFSMNTSLLSFSCFWMLSVENSSICFALHKSSLCASSYSLPRSLPSLARKIRFQPQIPFVFAPAVLVHSWSYKNDCPLPT